MQGIDKGVSRRGKDAQLKDDLGKVTRCWNI